MADRSSVKVISAALHETPQKEIILLGVIDDASLSLLRADAYQRETLSPRKIEHLCKAMSSGQVPSIELGMRGERYTEREGNFYLQDPVYIVDGLQRVTAALQLLRSNPDLAVQLSATVHFGTSEEWERLRFEDLNLGQTKLSSNITLRNKAATMEVADALVKLSKDKSFVLYDKVCWQQSMRRGELITATTLFKVAGMLHSHAGPGRGSSVLDIANGTQKIIENVGRATFVANVRMFYDILDQCWGVRRVAYRHGAAFLKQTFMIQLAQVFSNHTDFWEKDKLVLSKDLLTRLSTFPIDDTEVIRLASSSGMAAETLYIHLVNHFDRNKRTKRLKQRRGLHDKPTIYDDDSGYGEDEGEGEQ